MAAQEKVHIYIIYFIFFENNNNQQKKTTTLKSPVWRGYDEIKAGLAGCCVMYAGLYAFNDDTLLTVRTKCVKLKNNRQ